MTDSDPELEVLRACFATMRVGTQQVIRSRTNLAHTWSPESEDVSRWIDYMRKNLRRASHETIDSFAAANIEVYEIRSLFDLGEQFVILTDEKRKETFTNGGWDYFGNAYPSSNGILDCSRVGFNSDETEAIVYAGQQFNYRRGHGTIRLFARTRENWKQMDSARAWIS